MLVIIITAVFKFILMDWLNWRAFYIAGISLIWVSYILYRLMENRDILRQWGFKKENFKPSAIFLFPLVILSIFASLIYAYLNNSLLVTWHIVPILILYPGWGIIQQYLMLGIISRNMGTIFKLTISRYVTIFMVSALFSLIHYPNPFLMISTFLMEVIFITAYMSWRNLWVIGIAHGWIATFLLYYVLERDLWLEIISSF